MGLVYLPDHLADFYRKYIYVDIPYTDTWMLWVFVSFIIHGISEQNHLTAPNLKNFSSGGRPQISGTVWKTGRSRKMEDVRPSNC